MSNACRPRYKGWRDTDGTDGLGEPTLGEHGVHTELLAWGHHGQLQEPLVWPWEEFRPFYPITLLFKEAACAVQQSSAVIFMRLTAIRFPHEIYYASIIFNVCKVGETTKGNLLAYFLLIFKILMLKPFVCLFFFFFTVAVQRSLQSSAFSGEIDWLENQKFSLSDSVLWILQFILSFCPFSTFDFLL